MIPRFTRDRRDTIRRHLLDWYRGAERDLPWRRTKDPYRIWLSESMLQQTRVETVIPYYDRFIERFPTLHSLAVADEQDVLREWAGLGYYARARHLKRAAELMLREHDGAVPRDAAALRNLPGIGRYTSGAIRSIAFDEPAAIVDANVRRVIARLVAEPALSDADTWTKAEELVPDQTPGRFNQALMELGATVCKPRNPNCLACPLRRSCRAASSGDPNRYPARKEKSPPREITLTCGIVKRANKLLMLRRPSKGILGGLWEVPTVEGTSVNALIEALQDRTGLKTQPGEPVGTIHHALSHRAFTLNLFTLRLLPSRLRPGLEKEARWCTSKTANTLPLSTLTKKVLQV